MVRAYASGQCRLLALTLRFSGDEFKFGLTSVIGERGGGLRQDHRPACHSQYICWPPLMLSVDPVTKAAFSEQRNAQPRAIS